MSLLPVAPGPLHHLALTVANLEASSRFYGELLGMRETLSMTMEGGAFCHMLRIPADSRARIRYFDGGPKVGQIELVEWQDVPPATDVPERVNVRSHASNILSFAWDESLDELHERLVAAGVTCWTEPQILTLPGYGHIRAFIAEDPDGRPVELVKLPSSEEVRAFRASEQ